MSAKRLLRKKQVLAIVHVGNRISRESVLIITWREICAQTMHTAKNPGWNLNNQRRKSAAIITEEKWINDFNVLFGHEQEVVCSHRPVELLYLARGMA